MSDKVVINVVTGLLGAGKTCAVMHLVLDPHLTTVPAIVVGEFAEEGVDGTILGTLSVPVSQLSAVGTGEDTKSYLTPLKNLVNSGNHKRIYLETSGVTEIHRVVADLLDDKELLAATEFGVTTTVIDGGAFTAHNKDFSDQLWSQIGIADLVVLNKTDRCSKSAIESIKGQVLAECPHMKFDACYMGQLRRGLVNDRQDDGFRSQILRAQARSSEASEFETFTYRNPQIVYDRVKFGHLLLNLPDAKIARFKGQLKVWDKTYCVNGMPNQLDWDNTPVSGKTAIAFIGTNLLAHEERIRALLDEEITAQNDHSRFR